MRLHIERQLRVEGDLFQAHSGISAGDTSKELPGFLLTMFKSEPMKIYSNIIFPSLLFLVHSSSSYFLGSISPKVFPKM